MAVVGFNVTKIKADASKQPKGKIKITPKIGIKDVVVQDFPMSKEGDQKVIVTKFEAGFTYEGGSEILLEGSQLYLVPTKIADEVEKEYEKSKKLPASVAQKIMSAIFSRCQMSCILLAKEIGLPCPVPLPKLSVKQDEKKAE